MAKTDLLRDVARLASPIRRPSYHATLIAATVSSQKRTAKIKMSYLCVIGEPGQPFPAMRCRVNHFPPKKRTRLYSRKMAAPGSAPLLKWRVRRRVTSCAEQSLPHDVDVKESFRKKRELANRSRCRVRKDGSPETGEIKRYAVPPATPSSMPAALAQPFARLSAQAEKKPEHESLPGRSLYEK